MLWRVSGFISFLRHLSSAGSCVDGAGSILVIERGPEMSRLLAAT